MAAPAPDRGRFARLGGPLVLALAIAGGLVAMGVLNHRTNRAGALALAERYVEAVDAVVAREVRDFLTPAETAVRLYAVAIGQNAVASEPDEAAYLRAAASRRLAFEMLSANPQFAAIFGADADGRFLMTFRTPEGAFGRRAIALGVDGRRIIEETLDADGRTLESRDAAENGEENGFDPRTRAWFAEAEAADGPTWTDVYTFFTDGRPGVTAAYAVAREHAPDIVTGVDIRLDDLSRQLGGIGFGDTGRAVIVDDAGAVLVAPAELGVAPGATEIDDPLLAQMRDRFRISRDFSGIVRVADSWYLAAFSRVGLLGGAPWWLLVAIPETEFARFVQQSNRDSLIVSVAVTGLALLLAGLLARQSAVADRRARKLAEKAALVDAQAAVAARIAEVAAAPGRRPAERAEESARLLAAGAGDRRAAFWRAEADGASVARVAGWDAEAHVALDPARLPAATAGALRAALRDGEAWRGAPEPAHVAAGACAEACETLIAAPIARDGVLLGAVLLEDPGAFGEAAGDALALARVAGAIAAAWLAEPAEAASTAAAEGGAAPAERPAPGGRRLSLPPLSQTAAALVAERTEALSAAAARSGLSPAGLDAALFPHVAVLTVVFPDAFALATPAADHEAGRSAAPLFAALADALRARAAAAGAPYLKLLGDRAVAATGFDADDPAEPAAAMAAMALGLQEDFARLAAGRRGARIARFGLEAGPAMGAALGEGGLALWGETPTVSGLLAETAPLGAVQTGDVAHAALVGRFAFQPRGAFYADGVGELTAYYLRGRR
ncbi:MAG: hypothetical protein EA355_02055 [Rhodobacteraceae bacterium]|nr:MAG: hypothetical protein EA355_02055 [Paracoccaceae bacterium]